MAKKEATFPQNKQFQQDANNSHTISRPGCALAIGKVCVAKGKYGKLATCFKPFPWLIRNLAELNCV
jgi:hypothetical protein